MSVDDMNPFFKIDISEEAEDTFVDDDSCDTQDDIVYEEHTTHIGSGNSTIQAVETPLKPIQSSKALPDYIGS